MFGLILTIYLTMGNGSEQCNDYIIDSFPTVEECVSVMNSKQVEHFNTDISYISCSLETK